EIHFRERLKLLQMPVQLASKPTRWTDGLAAGEVERKPSLTEWPVQGWSRVRTPGGDVAMLTQDAYSLSLNGGLWQWTLLRSPRMAWGGTNPPTYGGRNVHTDQGVHQFRLVLEAGGALSSARLATEARQLAQQPIVFDRYEGMNRPPWGNSPPRPLWTGAEQR